jgi:lipoate-protein ligase A
MSLPAEHPRAALLRDEALLDSVVPGSAPLVRWYTVSAPALVIGLGLRHRMTEIVDVDRCAAAGVELLERRAGGGLVLLDEHLLCGAVCVALPDARLGSDLTESYRWLGEALGERLRALGVEGARRVDVAEARADVALLRSRNDAVSRLLLATCYGALSPHEVAVGAAKLVGIAQVRRRHAALFQFGILLRDQSPLADYVRVPDEAIREELTLALCQRTIGLESLGVEPDGVQSLTTVSYLPPSP